MTINRPRPRGRPGPRPTHRSAPPPAELGDRRPDEPAKAQRPRSPQPTPRVQFGVVLVLAGAVVCSGAGLAAAMALDWTRATPVEVEVPPVEPPGPEFGDTSDNTDASVNHGRRDKARRLWKAAQVALKAGDPATAITKFGEVMTFLPTPLRPHDVAAVRGGKARAFSDLGKHTEAEAELRQAIRLQPKKGWPWHQLGQVLLAQKRCNKAAEAFKKAMRRGLRKPAAKGLTLAKKCLSDQQAARTPPSPTPKPTQKVNRPAGQPADTSKVHPPRSKAPDLSGTPEPADNVEPTSPPTNADDPLDGPPTPDDDEEEEDAVNDKKPAKPADTKDRNCRYVDTDEHGEVRVCDDDSKK